MSPTELQRRHDLHGEHLPLAHGRGRPQHLIAADPDLAGHVTSRVRVPPAGTWETRWTREPGGRSSAPGYLPARLAAPFAV